jgi:hypothetical protein
MTPDRKRLGQFAVACLVVALAALWCMVNAGCAPRESVTPAPSSSYTKAQITPLVLAWMAMNTARHSYAEVLPTGSMLPAIGSNSTLLLEASNGDDLQPGDVAIYANGRGDGGTICHRVRAVSKTAIWFTGDNNDGLRPDGAIAKTRVQWRVAAVIYAKR